MSGKAKVHARKFLKHGLVVPLCGAHGINVSLAPMWWDTKAQVANSGVTCKRCLKTIKAAWGMGVKEAMGWV